MAEGGDFGYDDPDHDNLLDHDDDDQEFNTTKPGAASTPYGEQYEMPTMMPDTSYDERTPLLSTAEIESRLGALREDPITGIIDTTKIPDKIENPLSLEDKEEQIRRVKTLIKKRFPNANLDRLVISYSTKNPMDIVVLGPKGGERKIVLSDGSDLQKSFLNKAFVKSKLGPPAEDVIQKTSEYIRKKQKELKEIRTSEQLKDEEIQTLDERVNREQAKIDQLKDDQETDNKVEIKRKEQLVKNLKKRIENQETGERRSSKKRGKNRST